MSLTIKKEVVDEGDELPTHQENIIHTRPFQDEIKLENSNVKLEIWYVEREGRY